jgi:hypothetical protein
MTTTTTHTVNGITFQVGDVVRGVRCGMFVIQKIKAIGGELMAVLKATDGAGRLASGTLALPFDAIVKA